jgi:curli biogenesis system outer membrane secretion channel CsgG
VTTVTQTTVRVRASRASHRFVLATILALTALLGCAAPGKIYVNGDADMSYYEKVAVLPFSNLSGQPYAGDRVMRTFVTELVITERFHLVDPGEFRAVLDRIGGLPGVDGAYDPKKLKDASKETGATGIIRGAVTEYGMQRGQNDERPILAFDVEMVDVQTSNIVWRASVSKRGRGRVPVIGGGGTRTLSRLTDEACHELVGRLEKEAF